MHRIPRGVVEAVHEVFDGVPQDSGTEGDKLLTKVREWWATYISTVTEADLDLLTLFTAHTHLIMESYTTPRLQLDSPVHGSGKTTCLEHFQRLCLRSMQMASLSSPALLTRMLDAEQRTVLIDEADRSLNPEKDGVAELLAVLNSGYKRGGTRPVLVPGKGGQWESKEMPTYAAVVIAGNNPSLPEDTRSRIIRVLLLPDLDGQIEESDWELIEEDANNLHDEISAWADEVRETVRMERPPLPKGIKGRFREKWSPLKRIAAVAGGDWLHKVDAMALQDKEQYELDKEDGLIHERPAVVLLRDIFRVWPEGEKFLPSGTLVNYLINTNPAIWGDESPFGKVLTTKRLGSMLAKGYKIHSVQPGRGGPRGYHRSAFTNAMHRMGVSPLQQSDASDASDESDAKPGPSVFNPEPVAPEDDPTLTRTVGELWDTCRTEGCTAGLWAPESQQLGYCAKCRKNDAA
jgi:Protein of unknown function (DUF3631)